MSLLRLDPPKRASQGPDAVRGSNQHLSSAGGGSSIVKAVGSRHNAVSLAVDVRPGGGRRSVRRSRRVDARAAEADLYPQGLAASAWFDSGSDSHPCSAIIRFSGRRVGATGRLGPGDSFVQDEIIEEIIPATGPMSITTRVCDVNPGEWSVTAEMLHPSGTPKSSRQSMRLGVRGSQYLLPAAWSWRRWALSTGISRPVKTRWAPLTNLARIPAVIPGSWPGLVLLGVVVGLTLQAMLIGRAHLDVGKVLAIGIVASVVGLVGAKAWYVALNLGGWREALRVGLCIQGFLVGALAASLGGLFILRLPVGQVLDATAPALFFGVAIGRLGCFFTGCCAGRQSASTWAIWSSDRRVGARRIPTQLLESLAALGIGVISLFAQIYSRPAVPGAIFLASFAAYTLCRQGLLRLRGEARRSAIGGPATAAVAATVLVASLFSVFLGVPRAFL